jgi:thermitase
MSPQHRPRRRWVIGGLAIAFVAGVILSALPRGGGPQVALATGRLTAGDAEQIIVKFRPTGSRTAAVQAAGAEEEGRLDALNVSVVRARPGRATADVIASLRADPRVLYAEPNQRRHATLIPNDTRYAEQWAPAKINAPAAWDISTGSTAVTIAVIDSGVDTTHPDFSPARFVAGYDFIGGTVAQTDDFGHGTHVAGIAAGTGNNATGIAGMSWNTKIMPLKVLDSHGDGWDTDVAAAITYAADRNVAPNNVRVINLSLGGPATTQLLNDAISYALGRGVLVVAAAGNTGLAGVDYPAALPGVMAVAATDSSDAKSSFSTSGPEVSVAAPGSSILSTVPTGTCEVCHGSGYRLVSGTSMATPYVAGLAALLFSFNGNLTAAQVRGAIESSAVDLGDAGTDQIFGHGRINALAALQAVGATMPACSGSRGCPATVTATATTTTTICSQRIGCPPTGTVTATATATATQTQTATAIATACGSRAGCSPTATATATATATTAPCRTRC